MHRRRWSVAAVAVTLGAVLAGCGGNGSIDDDDRQAARQSQQDAQSCATAGWTTGVHEDRVAPTDAPLYNLDTQPGNCFDEVGLHIDTGEPVGYRIEYSDRAVGVDGAPLIRPIGERLMLITVNARATDTLNPGQAMIMDGAVDRYRTIQSVVFGGRGVDQSTFVLGLRAEVPYTVSRSSSGGTTHVVVRLAHPPAA